MTIGANPGSRLIPLQGSDQEKAEAAAALVAVLEAARIVSVLLAPVTPGLAARIRAQLGLGDAAPAWADAAWGGLAAGQQTEKAQPVFARLEGDFVITPPAAAQGVAAAAAAK